MTIPNANIPTMPAQMPAQSVKERPVLYQNKSHLSLSRAWGPTGRDLRPFTQRTHYLDHVCMHGPFIGFAPFQAVLYLRAVIAGIGKCEM
jgi:hypothetical protein